MEQFAKVCEDAAKAGGRILLEMRGNFKTREKGPADLVTEADVASQETIRDLLLQAFPDHAFVGEEDQGEHEPQTNAEYTWIVDPLDGTTNYVHGMENFSVSIALMRRSEVIVGCVYDPVRDKSYRAIQGRGAFCNGHELRVSKVTALREALVAASFPPKVDRESEEVQRFLDVLVRCQALRRLGSAALNLCFVASGCLDAYWATSVRKWDVAAGLLIVQEAAGLVSALDGKSIDLENPRFLASSQAPLHNELIELFSA